MQIATSRNPKLHFSPLRYPGGKAFLHPFLADSIRWRRLESAVYVEPFAGGAGAALALLLLEEVERIVINDLDRAIYAFWKSAIFESEKFIEKINTTRVSISEWRSQKEIQASKYPKQFELGFSTFFLNRTNISGILDGGPIGGIEQKGRWKIDARFNKVELIRRISALSLYKNRITVSKEDGLDICRKYLGDKNAFVYLDPPYYDKGSTLYLNHYKENEHQALANYLNRHSKTNWVATYDNVKPIKALYPNRRNIGFSLRYNARDSRMGKELLILSDAFLEMTK